MYFRFYFVRFIAGLALSRPIIVSQIIINKQNDFLIHVLLLQPTYGTPVMEGFAQLRVYNGFNCNFTLNTANLNTLDMNATNNFEIGALSSYENLNIFADEFIDLPYYLKGEIGTECTDIAYSGYFHLKEKTANSFFINKEGLYNFTDNNDKAIDGVNVR